MSETATVRPQLFYQGDVYVEDLDYTVVDNAAPLDSLVTAVKTAAAAARTAIAAMAVAGITIAPAELLPSAYTWTPARLLVDTIGRGRSPEALDKISARLHDRAKLVSSSFTRVPLSASERAEDPDHGF